MEKERKRRRKGKRQIGKREGREMKRGCGDGEEKNGTAKGRK